jgi:hypothetical protein
MAILEISEGAAFVFVNLFILVGLVVGFYCSQKIERKRAKDVITSNIALTAVVSDLATVMKKSIQQNTIAYAVAQARAEEDNILE